jgi:hypothetical protein
MEEKEKYDETATLEYLLSVMRSGNIDPYAWSAVAIGRIRPWDIPRLIEVLKAESTGTIEDEGSRIIQGVKILLHLMGPQVIRALIGALKRCEDEEDSEQGEDWDFVGIQGFKYEIASAIAQFGLEALPILLETVKNPGYPSDISWTAGLAIGMIGKPAVPMLINAFKDESYIRALSHAFGQIGPVAISALIEALRSEDWRVRAGAAHSLYWMGKEAKAAIPLLKELAMRDANEQVRDIAQHTLKNIQK